MAVFGRKSPRQFQCNDRLWSTFQRMAEDQEKSVDDLMNDALEAYAQLAGYQTGIDSEADGAPATPPPVASPPRQVVHAPPAPPRPPPPPVMTTARYGRGMPSPGGGLNAMFQTGPASAAPPSPSFVNAADGTPGVPAPPLYLVFDSQKYRIDKDQFIIGRGAKSSDLPIKDGNISRKHAAVIRRNGTYYIKDLGSTNGIDFKGMRIDNKRIDEGDVFHLCDYELRFTYRR